MDLSTSMQAASVSSKMKLHLRVYLFDVILAFLKLLLLASTVSLLYLSGHIRWATAMLGALLAPGALETVYWLVVCCCDNQKRNENSIAWWIWMFNPLTFQLGTIIWSAIRVRDAPKYVAEFSMFVVLNSIQSFTETAAVTILQSVILISHWGNHHEAVSVWAATFGAHEGTGWVQALCILLSVVVLAKDFSRNHFHELSGKQGVPDFWLCFKGLVFFGTIVVCRMVSLVQLALFFRPYFFVLLLVLVLLNIPASYVILGANPYKSIWTGFASVLAPTCFVARTKTLLGKLFLRFYIVNAAIFWILNGLLWIVLWICFYNDPNTDWFFAESFGRVPFINQQCLYSFTGCPLVITLVPFIFCILELLMLNTVTLWFPSFLEQKPQNAQNNEDAETPFIS